MSVLTLVKPSDPILSQELKRFEFDNPEYEPNQLAVDLAETMIANKGLGLAANQIGIPYAVLAITGDPIRVMFNPRIVDTSEETVLMEEGCLSFPGLYLKLERPAVVKVRYSRPNGETVTEVFEGLSARIVQHEIDHLKGIKFASYVKETKVRHALEKIRRTGTKIAYADAIG